MAARPNHGAGTRLPHHTQPTPVQDYAAGKIQVVPPPSSGELQRSTPARYPHVVTREGLQSMREVLPGRQGAAGSAAAAGGGSGAAAAAKLDGSGDDEDMPDLGFEES